MTDQEVLAVNIQRWQEARKRREQEEQRDLLPKFKKLQEYISASGVKVWMTVPGGASIDGK